MKNVETEQKDNNFSNEKETDNEQNEKDYEVLTTNVLFYLMIFFTSIGTGFINFKLDEFLEPLKIHNPNYVFPSIADFKITLYALPIFCVK